MRAFIYLPGFDVKGFYYNIQYLFLIHHTRSDFKGWTVISVCKQSEQPPEKSLG